MSLWLWSPWSGLDATAHGTLSELLTETAASGAAVAFTEHSDHVVRSTATRVCELRNGRLTTVVGSSLTQIFAQLSAAMIGISIGLLCSRLVIPRIGIAMLTAAAAILAVLLIRWISPIRPLMSLLSADRTSAVPLTLLTAASAAILVAALFTTRAVTDRRE